MKVSAIERLLAQLRKRRLDHELDQEILAHLELAERDALAAGLSAEEARRSALRQFGGIEQMKEEHRDSRGVRWIDTLLRDFRYGLGSLIRDPGFTAIAVSVLALGIGANTAMFSIVNAVLLKPLPFADPDRIVRVWEAPDRGVTNATSTPDFLDWKRLGSVFDELCAENPISAALTGEGEPARLTGKAVTSGYFRVFATNASTGRTFSPEDNQPGAPPVVVLSHSAWQKYFGADPDILQRRPILDGEPHQVIGVLAPGAFDRDGIEFWKPLHFGPDLELRGMHWLTVHGRLREDATLAQAREQMASINAVLADVKPAYKRDWAIVVEEYARLIVNNNLRQSIVIAFGAAVLVLLIACSNVTNLLLARGATRKKELAVRAALGAGRGRLVAQLLTESLVLCIAGGAAGILLAPILLQIAHPILADLIPYTADVKLDYRVLAFAAVAAMSVGLIVGTLPSLQTNFASLSRSLNQSARGSSGANGRLRRFIVIGEVALSLVLICGAVLFFRSLLKLQQLDTGIRVDNVITLSADLPQQSYPTPETAAAFYRSVAAQLRATPGVELAAISSNLPLRWIMNGEGMQVTGVEGFIGVRFKRVDPDYFKTLDIPLLAGRGITERDQREAPGVVVINEALAARLNDAAAMTNPIGQHVRISTPFYGEIGSSLDDYEIVGVIRSERVSSPGNPDPAVAYVPIAQAPRSDVKLLVRTGADPAAMLPGIREAVRAVDPHLPLGDIATMQQVREGTLSGASRPAWVIGAFATVAALLAALGLYGVLAHAVTQQRREIGIRMALGARAQDVLSHVLRGALKMILIGLALGLAGAFALTRVIQNQLFEVSALDPLALAVACGAMTLIGLFAGAIPASRAAAVNPVTVLRDEG